ncbi:MAG: hypothetical protein Q9168_005938 [Polycauliona sp. 1 TL-2023]
MMPNQREYDQQSATKTHLLVDAVQPSLFKTRPIIRLPLLPKEAFNQHLTTQVDTNSAPPMAHSSNDHGEFTPPAEPETWQDRFKRLTGNAIDGEQGQVSSERYHIFEVPNEPPELHHNTTELSSSSSSSSSSTTQEQDRPSSVDHDDVDVPIISIGSSSNTADSSSSSNGSTIAEQDQEILVPYDAVDVAIEFTEPSRNTTGFSGSNGSAIGEKLIPDQETYHHHHLSDNSTPPSTISVIQNASISSQTAALLMEGAKANWRNMCEALLIGVSRDDQEILEQIMGLVEKLGTGSGPLSLAHHQPHSAELVGPPLVNIGAASIHQTRVAEEKATESVITAEVARQTKGEVEVSNEEEASSEEEEELLQARKERIAMSLLMRRQEQPIRKA